MKKRTLDTLVCVNCGAEYRLQKEYLECVKCKNQIPLIHGIPVFTEISSQVQPTEKVTRGPHIGTPWRQANWKYIEDTLSRTPSKALILDIGSGRGDFEDLLKNRDSIALDIYPYPEVDIVCDLLQKNPFQNNRFDLVLLTNTLEHIEEPYVFLKKIIPLLKPGGLLLVTIPFFVKLHQMPLDFVRFTQFSLVNIGKASGLEINRLDGFYDVVSLLEEGLSNLRYIVAPELKGLRRRMVLVAHLMIKTVSGILRKTLGPGKILPVIKTINPAPVGYLIQYRKPS